MSSQTTPKNPAPPTRFSRSRNRSRKYLLDRIAKQAALINRLKVENRTLGVTLKIMGGQINIGRPEGKRSDLQGGWFEEAEAYAPILVPPGWVIQVALREVRKINGVEHLVVRVRRNVGKEK